VEEYQFPGYNMLKLRYVSAQYASDGDKERDTSDFWRRFDGESENKYLTGDNAQRFAMVYMNPIRLVTTASADNRLTTRQFGEIRSSQGERNVQLVGKFYS
jgi:hypothetical protein